MDYSFNCEIAKQYGVNEAVFIHNIYWWIRKNEANGRHYYDGKNWTYNTMDAFVSLFPFWTRRQVERIIHKLRDNGAIYVGNYNAQKFDRTQWYALSETVTSIYANGEKEIPKPLNAITQTVTTIPDSKPDNKQQINKNTNAPAKFTPPTLEEIKAYCLERKNNVDPQRFFDYFDASDWIDSEGKSVRNWKQKIITWEGGRSGSNQRDTSKLPAGNNGETKPKYGNVV